MRRTMVACAVSFLLGLALPLTFGVEIATPLFALASRFAAASSPVYAVSVGSAYEGGGGPTLPTTKVRR